MSTDLSQFPQELQAIIQQEIAKALAAAQPPAPRELTPAELAELAIVQAVGALRGEKAISAGSLFVHERILTALAIVTKQVFSAAPQVAEAPAADTGTSVEAGA